MKIPQKAKTFLRLFISASLIGYLIYSQDFGAIFAAIRSFEIFYLVVAVLLLLLGTYISAIRWKTILQTSNLDVSVKELFILYIKGYFYNNFLPTQMGGDVYKSVSLGKKINDQSTALFSVFMDRFGGLLVLLVLGFFGISSLLGIKGILIGTVLFVTGLFLYFPVLNFLSKKVKFLEKFKKASELFVKNKDKAFLVLFQSFLVQMCSFTLAYILFIGVGVYLPFWSVVAFMPITSLSLLIPSLNGLGTQELVYAYLFKGAGVTESMSIAVSLMVHAVRITMSLIGGALILFGVGGKRV